MIDFFYREFPSPKLSRSEGKDFSIFSYVYEWNICIMYLGDKGLELVCNPLITVAWKLT